MSGLARLLDRVFVEPRGRWPGFAERFPSALPPAPGARAFLRGDERSPLASVLVKRRRVDAPAGGFELAMIGGVATLPEERGRGCATSLLREAEAWLDTERVPARVLFTANPGFYERLGWEQDDAAGALGELHAAPPGADAQVRELPVAEAAGELERLRAAEPGARLVRAREDWRTCPFPAERTLALLAEAGDSRAGAVAGLGAATVFVYEAHGGGDALAALWAELARRGRVLVNGDDGGAMRAFLDGRARVSWSPRGLALWKGGPRCPVPFLDRI